MTTVFATGTWCFIKDEDECFIPAKVIKSFKAGEPGTVQPEDGEVEELSGKETSSLLHMDDESLKPIENMVKLKELNEASILQNLRLRFKLDKIYTNVGTILVSVNPFKLLPIYTPEVLDKYKERGARDLPPHVYGVADDAYRSLQTNKKNQSCIVSGESGAGKTEATKLFLQYIGEISGGVKGGAKKAGAKPAPGESASLQEQILKANPLMEAFGNAKTLRNNNSSRFGKWIEVKFDKKGSIVGGSITNYLLEKSRLVHQMEGERNYHVFYDLLAGAEMDPAMKERLQIKDADDYHYLNQSGVITAEGINDEREWEDMIAAMKILNMTQQQIDDVMQVLAGILHLGNIEFEIDERPTQEDGSKISNRDMLELAAQQFGADPEALDKALCYKNIGNRSVIFVSYSVKQAADARDALAKTLYGNLFDWLISMINRALAGKVGTGIKEKDVRIIGVLDIFGFESFETNSFEQLCINYCNEKLQFHFNEHIFKLEAEEYKREGIDVSAIEFADNQPCLTLLEQKGMGVFSMIDEEINVPRGSDEGFLHKVIKRHAGHKNCEKPGPKALNSHLCFDIIHYAGKVSYNVTGFLEKNKDLLHADLQGVCKTSRFGFIKMLFEEKKPKAAAAAAPKRRVGGRSKKSNKKTLGTQFKEQLATLMQTLNSTEPHFIRCIKPNSEKCGDIFTSQMVLDQLRYAGLLEVCRIRQIGYPIRKEFPEFLQRYLPLYTSAKNVKELCKGLADEGILKGSEWQMGHSKVFMRNIQFNEIEGKREDALKSVAMRIQKIVRRFICRCRFVGWKAILDDLRAAIAARSEEKLESALSDAGDLPNHGNHIKVVKDAQALLERLAEERRVNELLENAISDRDLSALTSALNVASAMNLKSGAVDRATELVERIKEERRVLETLKEAIAARSIEKIAGALAAASALDLSDTEEFRQASALKQRLEEEEHTITELSAALEDRHLDRILGFLAKAGEMGLDHPVVDKARQVKDELQNEITARNGLKAATAARDLAALERAMAKMAEAGIGSDPAMTEAADLKATLEREGELEKELSAAMGTRDEAALKKLLSKATQMDMTAASSSVVADGRKLLKRLEGESACLAELASAAKSGDLSALSAAVAKAGDLGITEGAELQAAQSALKKLGKKAEMASNISSAIAVGDVDKLEALVGEASSMGGLDAEIAKAKAAIARLGEEKVTIDAIVSATEILTTGTLALALEGMQKHQGMESRYEKIVGRAKAAMKICNQAEAAMKDRDAGALDAVLAAAQENGFAVTGTIKAAQDAKASVAKQDEITSQLKDALRKKDEAQVKSLLAQVTDDMPENDTFREARILAERDRVIAETKSAIDEATRENDLDKLNAAMEKVIELGMEGPEVDAAKELRKKLELWRENASDLVAACNTLKAKAKAKAGIVEADIAPLTAVIGEAKVPDDLKEMVVARELEKRMQRQIVVQAELADALKKGDFKVLKAALDHAQELDLDIELVRKVRSAVRQKDAERRAAQRAAFEAGEVLDFDEDEEEEDVDEDELQRKREEKIAKASNERYSFRKFHKIRDDQSFTKGRFNFSKRKMAENKLNYQTSVIPRSILELERSLSKTATRIHKSILVYCGDKSLSFPAVHAQSILTKGLENPDLIDEIYVQICKHLTHNPKPESVGRAWQLMCMAVGTFPPSSDFEYYLLNFIIEHRSVPGLIGNYARYALRRLEGMLSSGASGFVPSVDEIQAYKERPPILATIELVDGTPLTEDLPITPDLSVAKVLEICTHFLDLTDSRANMFGIFVVETSHDGDDIPTQSGSAAGLPRTPRPLRSEDFMGDIVVQMTRQSKALAFVFKRKIFLASCDGPSEDPMYNRLLYLQAQDEIIASNLALPNEQEVAKVTAIAIAVDCEEFPASVDELIEAEMSEYLPNTWRDSKSEDAWGEAVLAASGDLDPEASPEDLQDEFLTYCKSLEMYGAHLFYARVAGTKAKPVESLPDDVICAFNSDGLTFLDTDHKPLMSYGYADIYRWGGSSSQFSLIIWAADLEDTFEMSLYTSQAADMAALILDYINAIMAITS